MVRNSLRFVPWKDYKPVTRDLKLIYQATTEAEVIASLDQFSEVWDEKYPQISKSWRDNWSNLSTLFNYPPEIRKAIYTTNAIGTPGQAWLSQQMQFLPGQGLASHPELSVARPG